MDAFYFKIDAFGSWIGEHLHICPFQIHFFRVGNDYKTVANGVIRRIAEHWCVEIKVDGGAIEDRRFARQL